MTDTLTTFDPPRTPRSSWAEMVEGNSRFIAGAPQHPRQDAERREELAHAQAPLAALFGCSDSRLAAEIIFDKGIGDLFVVRNAGQVISHSVVGSLEYAVAVLGVPLIVVLGHDKCGAVRAAIDSLAPDAPALPPHIQGLISKIVPAVRRVAGSTESDDGELASEQAGVAETESSDIDVPRIDVSGIDVSGIDSQAVGREHLRDTIGELLALSELISDAVAAGILAIVGANYRLVEGVAVPDIIIGDIGGASVPAAVSAAVSAAPAPNHSASAIQHGKDVTTS